ncbi:hypothetical protein EV424DRAFT_1603571 [Suillus variegatus]|nr:hypothetical protein EV424DRAFT_1603571 [Suillus variegatus]
MPTADFTVTDVVPPEDTIANQHNKECTEKGRIYTDHDAESNAFDQSGMNAGCRRRCTELFERDCWRLNNRLSQAEETGKEPARRGRGYLMRDTWLMWHFDGPAVLCKYHSDARNLQTDVNCLPRLAEITPTRPLAFSTWRETTRGAQGDLEANLRNIIDCVGANGRADKYKWGVLRKMVVANAQMSLESIQVCPIAENWSIVLELDWLMLATPVWACASVSVISVLSGGDSA